MKSYCINRPLPSIYSLLIMQNFLMFVANYFKGGGRENKPKLTIWLQILMGHKICFILLVKDMKIVS
jgi:hypothetical protein